MSGRGLIALSLAAASLVLATGCGDDDSEGEGGSTETDRVEQIAACAEAAGFDPTIDDGVESGAIAIDLTTEDATIVVHVFDSEADAAAYIPKSSLDAEQVGSALILGGAIPPAQRDTIAGCIEAA
jgi:hypothetical protein